MTNLNKQNAEIIREVWHKWVPLEGLVGRFYLQSLVDDLFTLKIILENDKKTL